MWVIVNRKKTIEIDNEVVRKILNFYPEECLEKRPIFKIAFEQNEINIKNLRDESEKISLPWQMFFLNERNLYIELEKIEKLRKDKFSEKLLTKREGMGEITSKRILDRLIRIQNYIVSSGAFKANRFCGVLKGKKVDESVEFILNYFQIDLNKFRNHTKVEDSLNYLIEVIQNKNVNISRGVFSNGLLLNHQVVKSKIYKNTSGFAIKDPHVPFIFLPSEINPDEIPYRQIYTLIYLLVAIGRNAFDYFVENNFSFKKRPKERNAFHIHNITSQLLFSSNESEKMRGTIIDTKRIGDLKYKLKISPTAILTILKIRKIITAQEYQDLKPEPFVPSKLVKTGHYRSAFISTSVKKFCGTVASNVINKQITSKKISNAQAQYLLFGRINKNNYKAYLQQSKI